MSNHRIHPLGAEMGRAHITVWYSVNDGHGEPQVNARYSKPHGQTLYVRAPSRFIFARFLEGQMVMVVVVDVLPSYPVQRVN